VALDCVVSDYDMHGLTGLELLEAVRAVDPDVPFILFTGKGSETIASRAISEGATDYLQMTSGTDQYTMLADRIENAVETYRSRRVLAESQDASRGSSISRRWAPSNTTRRSPSSGSTTPRATYWGTTPPNWSAVRGFRSCPRTPGGPSRRSNGNS
jgi:DNA-binding NtrC family response regulator